jgi:hypothetical protein
MIFVIDEKAESSQKTFARFSSILRFAPFMKADTRKTLFSFLVELAVYTILITFYFFLVLHFLGSWLEGLGKESIKLYALVAITLIIGQAVLLEWVTTFLFRLLRGRSE